ncbi:MAG TPA: hypothetical protein VLK66_21155 [Longimicrobium sp.]|nr:hypothetical protein [Longimicrobium sp.]
MEIVLVLFYIEDLKDFVVESIRATDRVAGLANGGRLPLATKNLYKKAWAILVDAGVLSQQESDEIQELVDYRNVVAHQTDALTADVGRYTSLGADDDAARYNHSALERVQYFREKLAAGMSREFLLSVSFRGLNFEAAERTYLEELAILNRKLRRQIEVARSETDQANAQILELRQSDVLGKLEPGHPAQINRSGQLTAEGIHCCRELFIAGASPFVVAHLMRLSLRAATRQHKLWLATARPAAAA